MEIEVITFYKTMRSMLAIAMTACCVLAFRKLLWVLGKRSFSENAPAALSCLFLFGGTLLMAAAIIKTLE